MATARLSALDAAFVALDRPAAPFVVGAILVFDREPLLDASGQEVDRVRLRARVARVLEDLPGYRQRLGHVPVLGHPTWVDDQDFELAAHVRFTALVEPGGAARLDAWVGELFSMPLPRDRPPWQLWCVDDPGSGTVALVAKVHHALLDGIVGVRLLDRLLSTEPGDGGFDGEVRGGSVVEVRAQPRGLALLEAEVAHRAGAAVQLVRSMCAAPRGVLRSTAALLVRALRSAPDVGLDAPRGGSHAIARFELALDLAGMKRLGASHSASVNDLLLAMVAGALRRMLLRRGIPAARLAGVRAMVPANTRSAADTATSGNRVALLLVGLPVDEQDPAVRIARVHAETSTRRSAKEIDAGEALVRLADATTPRVLATLLRVGIARRAFNVVVTNIPGPSSVRYLLGARLRALHPIVNLWPGQALGLAFSSYDGRTQGCVHVLPGVVGDLASVVRDFRSSSDELGALAAVGA